MALHFISYARVGMQRAGLLVGACAVAEDRRPTNLDRVSTKVADLVQREVLVPYELRASTQKYLGSLRLWKRYGHLRGRDLIDSDRLQIQDLWLADDALPSATGALTPENATEIPQLSASLRLVRESNFTRTDRGRALLLATGPYKVEALTAGQSEPNPFALTPGAQLLILAALLEADADFLQSIWRTTPVLNAQEFSRADFASGLAGACADLRIRSRRHARSGADQRLLIRLAEWEEAVGQERKSGSEWGGGRPPDQLATVRLEPFVDVGMISRMDRFAYRYCLNEGQRSFWRQLAGADDSAVLIRRNMVASWLSATSRTANRADESETWDAIRDAYQELRSSLGFASFAEVVLVAIGRLLGEKPARWFELQDGIDLLTERRRQSPKEVRLGINRAGELTYMKLSETARTA